MLQALFSNPAIREELSTSHESTDGIRRDYCDGEFYQQHPVFCHYKNALQFILYYDDIEVANPLGSSTGKNIHFALVVKMNSQQKRINGTIITFCLHNFTMFYIILQCIIDVMLRLAV